MKLVPAQYVKPYVKRGKNDAADAEAICEAVTRPTMHFVGIKSPEQQSAMMLHRVRLILSRQRTQLSNALRTHLAEFGIVAPIGRNGIDRLLSVIADSADHRLPPNEARTCLEMLVAQLHIVKEQILENDRRIMASARETELGRRLMEIPGVGPLLASAIVATVPDPAIFRSGRDLAAWIGLENILGDIQTDYGNFRHGRLLNWCFNTSIMAHRCRRGRPPHQFMRDNWLSNRVFTSHENIIDHCCEAWIKLIDQPWRIMTIGRRKWARGS